MNTNNSNIIRFADARTIIENTIRICFGRYFRSEDYIFEGKFFSSYELFEEMYKGALKIAVSDKEVEFKLDGYTIFVWSTTGVSEVDEDRILKHLEGFGVKGLYIDFFNTAKKMCEEFING